MPWTVADVDKHRKGLTQAQKKKWVKVANGVLKQCQADGGTNCDAKAIRVANSKFSMEGEMRKEKIPRGALSFTSEGAQAVSLAQEDEEAKLDMTVYSGGLIEGHWYWGRLAIDLEGIKFSKGAFPVLEEHNTDKKIAFSKDPIVKQGEGIVLDPAKTKFVDTDESHKFRKVSAEGFPYESSMFVIPSVIERVEEDASVDVNGIKLKGPGAVFRQCAFQEASVCTFGWDSNTKASTFSKEEVELDFEERFIYAKTNEGNLNEGKEVDTKMELTLEKLMEDHSDLYDEIVAKVKSELEEKFTKSKDDIQKFIKGLTERVDGLEAKTKALEVQNLEYAKNETLRQEAELVAHATAIWVEKLSASNIPDHLYDKVKPMVSHTKFIEDGKFDRDKFSEAIDAEIADWEEKGVVSSVLGKGVSTKTVDDDPDAIKLAKQSDDAVSKLLNLAGQKTETT